jgi:serine protease
MTPNPRRPALRLPAAWLVLLLAATAAHAQPLQAADERPAHGLIVRLKDSPAHDDALPAAAARWHGQRWQRVLAAADLSRAVAAGNAAAHSGAGGVQMRPVARDAQLLDLGRPLPAAEAQALATRLRALPEVDWVAPNVIERRLQADPLRPQQWWLRPVGGTNSTPLAERRRGVPGFEAAWASGIPGAGGSMAPVVAVLDTGIVPHPDLQGRILPGHDFVTELAAANDGDGRDADPADPGDWIDTNDRQNARFADCAVQRSSWHGTVIAGLVAAVPDNGIGVAGINPPGRVLPVRVAGKCGAAVADILDGMRWAAGLPVAGAPANPNPARIVNISFGGAAPCSAEYQSTLAELRARNVVVVAAAGNDHATVARPANCPGVVGVAAVNRDGFKTHYSNFGSALAASGIATVGGDDNGGGAWRAIVADSGIVGVWNSGETAPGRAEYAALFGTSFAAPMVSGTLALMLSVNPQLSASGMVDGLRLSARPHLGSPLVAACSNDNPGRCACTTSTCGAGLLDATEALRYAADPLRYVAPAWAREQLDNTELQRAVALGADRPANVAANPAAPGDAGGGGGGGGVAGTWPWGLALAAATWALRRRPPRHRPHCQARWPAPP